MIRDPGVECASPDELVTAAGAAWDRQRRALAEGSPFYRHKLAAAEPDAAGMEHLASMPFTTKDELQVSQRAAPPFGDFLSAEPAELRRVYRTSGTTGDPLLVAATSADLAGWTEVGLRSYTAAGIEPGTAVLSTLGAGPYVAGHTYAVLDALGCRVVPIAPGDGSGAVAALRAGLADALLTTPTFALHLARRMGGAPAALRRIVTGAEPGGGLPAVRATLAEAFGAEVAEVLGLAEVGPSLFGECAAGIGMHFCGQGRVWMEMIDGAGQPVPVEDGATGELVYTTLVREAMPLVRYRSGDVARVGAAACSCGRAGAALRVVGRRDDMFVVRGVNVFPSAVQAVVAGLAATGRSRVVLPAGAVSVEAPVTVEVEAVGDAGAAAIAAALRERLGFRASVSLVGPESFGPAGYKTPAVRRT